MLGKIKDYLRKNTKYGKSRYLNYLYRYDLEQYMEHSCLNESNPERIATHIRILIHAIEKGMSLSKCREGFGKEKILELISLNSQYQSYTNIKDKEIDSMVHSIVSSYIVYHEKRGIKIDFVPDEYYKPYVMDDTLTGTLCIPVDEGTEFSVIAHHRHSTRSFKDKKIPDELIEQVVQLAQTAPSACNRQAIKIYACVDKHKKEAIMKMHGGVRGFDMPGVVYVVTGNLNLYQNEYERNAVYIDGGIFLMNLLYAIDSVGLASCPIIWGSEPTNDEFLAELIGIPKSEKIISLALSGYYPSEEYIAAVSSNRDLKYVLKIV